MNKNSILNAVKIINYAIDNNVSVRNASVECGFGNTYVKNVKSRLIDEHKNGLVYSDDYNLFFDAYKTYKKSFEKNNQISLITTPQNKISQKENDKNIDIEYTSNSSYPKGHIKTLKQLLEKCEVDLDVWNVKESFVNKWDVTSWKNNKPQTIENFQVKARLEKKQYVVDEREIRKIFVDNINKYKIPTFNTTLDKSFKHVDNMLEICLFDTHFNKYVWTDETDDTYNVEIAEKRFLTSVQTFIERAKGFGFNRILFPVGNDFFNSDGMGNSTTAGTPQDNQLLWHQAFRRGVKLIKDAIYLMKQTGVYVDVMVVAGNHDFANSFYLGEYLAAWFKDDKLVTIDNSPNPRKYYSYGEVLLGFTHGSEEKRDSLPMIMANQKDLWSKSKFREWHLGHYHRKKNYNYTVLHKGLEVDEEDGMIIRYLSSLAGTDSWHNKKGYISNVKGGDGFIWSSKDGLIAHININI